MYLKPGITLYKSLALQRYPHQSKIVLPRIHDSLIFLKENQNPTFNACYRLLQVSTKASDNQNIGSLEREYNR